LWLSGWRGGRCIMIIIMIQIFIFTLGHALGNWAKTPKTTNYTTVRDCYDCTVTKPTKPAAESTTARIHGASSHCHPVHTCATHQRTHSSRQQNQQWQRREWQ
jgi:hypothetical protein